MDRHLSARLLSLALWTALGLLSAVRGQSALGPEGGLLLLRNGRVIEGQVTRAGDFYVVTQGAGVELRMKASEVEAFCGSLTEAYEFKRSHLLGNGAAPHLDLAEWCLRHNLHAHCGHELAAAMRIAPNDQRLRSLENRLQLATEAPGAPEAAAQTSSATVSAEQLENVMRSLPKGSVEKFSANIQPILLNRCGANQCHGPNAKSDFRLLRPPAGQIASRRFTQRNLYAALQYVDQSNPDASPLVTMPQKRHGTSLTAVFDKHTQNQLNELIAWSKITVATRPATAPQTIGAPPATLSQPAAAAISGASREDAGQRLPPAPTNGATQDVQVMRPPFDDKTPARVPAGPQPFAPKDRFDPEIFNRRFHSGK